MKITVTLHKTSNYHAGIPEAAQNLVIQNLHSGAIRILHGDTRTKFATEFAQAQTQGSREKVDAAFNTLCASYML